MNKKTFKQILSYHTGYSVNELEERATEPLLQPYDCILAAKEYEQQFSERQSTIKDNNNADEKALHTADVVFSEKEVCQLKKAEYERGVEDGKIITEHGTVNWQT